MIGRGRMHAWIGLFFFLSGICALVYEIVWGAMLHHVFGYSVLATATVLAAYMGGFALGSFLFGKKADASKHPIQPGDLLTTSDTPGHSMKVTDHGKAQGAILGKAMSSLEQGKGLVLVLVTLQ